MPPETIQIPRAWLEGLLNASNEVQQAVENHKFFTAQYLYGYIESAKSLLDK